MLDSMPRFSELNSFYRQGIIMATPFYGQTTVDNLCQPRCCVGTIDVHFDTKLTHAFNWSDWVESREEIEGTPPKITSTDIIIDSSYEDGATNPLLIEDVSFDSHTKKTTFKLSGGIKRGRYKFWAHIETCDGQQDKQCFFVNMRDCE